MSATVAAALKKIAVSLLTNPKILKTVLGIVLGIIIDRMTVFWTVFCGLFKILSSVFISCLEQKSIQLQIELEFSYSIFGEVCPRYRTRCIRQRMLRVLLLCDTHCGIPVLF